MKKKLLLILSVIILSLCCVFCVSAEDAIKCGENVTCTFDEKTETIFIEGTGKMSDISILDCIAANADKNLDEIKGKYKTAVIANGITHIGNNAFDGFYAIEAVEIGKDVKTIGDSAFRETKIRNLIIPDSVTSIGNEAFYYCNYIESITLGKGLTSIGDRTFYVNEGVIRDRYEDEKGARPETVTVPENVKTIGEYAFGFGWDEYDDIRDDYIRGGLKEERLNNFTLIGAVDSAAYEYCEKYAVAFDDIDGCKADAHKWGGRQTVKEKTCGKDAGLYCNQCKKCGARRYEFGETYHHEYLKSTKKTIKKATYFKKGKEKAYCLNCKKYITYKTPKRQVENPKYKLTKGSNQVTFNFTNSPKKISYYTVTISTNKKIVKECKVTNKKLTVKGLKKNKDYFYEINGYYTKGGKTAFNRAAGSFKLK